MLENDPIANVLYVDLSEKRAHCERREDLFSSRLGGTGVAIRLLHEECPEGIDPLDPENPIIFAVGPLNGIYPIASKTVAMFKSPHTGDLGESHCGGRSATSIRMAGYGAIVIKGSSELPLYLTIHDNDVYFRDASTLWGMESSYTVGRVIREREKGSGVRTIMRIGRAGEKLVPFANVITETYRHFGRLGLGAVFGSKKLKAILVSGKGSLSVGDKKRYRKLYDDIYEKSTASPAMEKYHDIGTPVNVDPLNEIGALPTRNLQSSKFEDASKISGESFAEGYLGRRLACAHCPVGCIHIAALREPYEDESYFYKTSFISYDYEPIFALASMLGGSDTVGFLKLLDRIEDFGLDAMSTGVVLGWATEAQEKGIISEKETLGIKLSWGDYPNYIEAVQNLVNQPNTFYRDLAQGVEKVSSKYGGEDFALSFGGNEMAGYHTGHANYVGLSIGARHSHLDNAGYSLDQKLPKDREVTPEELTEKLVKEERWRQILSSLVVCFFARDIYSPEIVSQALDTMGFEFTPEDLSLLGKEIHEDKYDFKFREGFSLEKLRLPKRIFETSTPQGELNETYIRNMIDHFGKIIRGEKVV